MPLNEIIDALTEMQRMKQLNLELLEQLNVACAWLLENKVEVPNVGTFVSLVAKSTALLDEMNSKEARLFQYRKLADEKKHLFGADEDVPEPFSIFFLSNLNHYSFEN